MKSFLLRQVAKGVLPVIMVFAIYLLLRGHDAPGGGFVSGLVTTAAMVLHALAHDERDKRHGSSHVWRSTWIGLLVATGSGLVAVGAGAPFLTHYHFDVGDGALSFSTTLVFDIGVFLVVIGSMSTALAVFAEDT